MITIDDYRSILSIFLRLNMPIVRFQQAFHSSSIDIKMTPLPIPEFVPGMPLGPQLIQIGKFEDVIITYNPERYLLQATGSFK